MRVALVLILAACSAAPKKAPAASDLVIPNMADAGTSIVETAPTATPASDAPTLYRQALEQFKAHDYDSARATFSDLNRRFAYSRYAVLAQLHIVDIEYALGDFANAATHYQEWTAHHPGAPEAPLQHAKLRYLCADLQAKGHGTVAEPPEVWTE